MSLISGFLPYLIIGLAVLVLLAGVDWRARNRLRHLAAGVATAIVLTDLLALAQLQFNLVPYPFPDRYYAWVAAIWLALGLCFFGRRIGWWRRALTVLAVPLTLASALVLINVDFQAYPSISSLTGSGAQHQTSIEALLAKHHTGPNPNLKALAGQTRTTQTVAGSPASVHPAGSGASYGESAQVDIPATKSHFTARPAWIWVPPAYVSGQVSSLPVLMLLGGSPGRTNDWLRAGFADRTAEAFAEHHNGLAPMLVMPDANGSVTGDTECVDGSAGNAETYLTADVPAYLHAKFGTPTGRSYAVAGFSEGGTCAAMLALRHPTMFTGFADFSGLTSPSLTERVNAKVTALNLFDGSMTDYVAHDPLELLKTHNLHGGAYFQVGSNDASHLAAQRTLVALARKTDLTVCAAETPSAGHTYGFWGQALADALPTLSGELNVTTPPKPGCSTPSTVKAGGASPDPGHS